MCYIKWGLGCSGVGNEIWIRTILHKNLSANSSHHNPVCPLHTSKNLSQPQTDTNQAMIKYAIQWLVILKTPIEIPLNSYTHVKGTCFKIDWNPTCAKKEKVGQAQYIYDISDVPRTDGHKTLFLGLVARSWKQLLL